MHQVWWNGLRTVDSFFCFANVETFRTIHPRIHPSKPFRPFKTKFLTPRRANSLCEIYAIQIYDKGFLRSVCCGYLWLMVVVVVDFCEEGSDETCMGVIIGKGLKIRAIDKE